MLISYADSLGKNLKELKTCIDTYLKDAVGSVHILPFFPSSADRGFAPISYKTVDPAFGNWEDIAALAKSYPLMFDFMINHISRQSELVQDFCIDWDAFWGKSGASESDVVAIYKRKDRAPFVEIDFGDTQGKRKVWCTFGEEQIDLDLCKPAVQSFFTHTINELAAKGASIIRLDAFAYAVKKAGSSCFFVEPEIWELLGSVAAMAKKAGVEILPEIHEHYSIQMKLAEKGYWVYDFALPALVLHALYSGRVDKLANWLKICPRKQWTTLDTHDGIGMVDVVDLLSPEEIDFTRESLYKKGANVQKKYSSAEYNNLDVYQINCTYYSALGNNDDAYLLARAVQFFAPGIPQVYYTGLLAGINDIELLEKTKNGRDINRHYYTLAEVASETKRPVVKKLLELCRLRNTHPAFAVEADIEIGTDGEHSLFISRTYGAAKASLQADFNSYIIKIDYNSC